MRYTKAHKAESRDRIVEAARSIFRRNGFEQASIDQIMGAAGLTRGAFYAHFSSKEELVAVVMDLEAGLVRELRQAIDARRPDDIMAAMQRYLSPEQRADVATGCPLVAHPIDAIRGTDDRKLAYENQFSSLVNVLEAAGLPEDLAIEISITAVGTGLISAAMSTTERANKISEVGTRTILTKLRTAMLVGQS